MSDFDGIDELSSDARALIEGARGGDEPTSADRARVRRAVMAAIAAGAGAATAGAASSAAAASGTSAATTTTATTTTATATTATGAAGAAAGGTAAASGATAGLATSVKLAAALMVAGAVGGTVAVAPWEPDEASTSHVAQAVEARTANGARPAERLDPSSPAPTPEAAESPEPEPARLETAALEPAALETAALETGEPSPEATQPPAPSHARRAPRASPATVPPATVPPATASPATVSPAGEPEAAEPEAAPSASSLAAEVALLRRAQAAINQGDADAALRILAEHASQHPSGVMAAEREAARVVALCRAGREAEARAASARFLRAHPQSPLRARVQSACATR
ncbi:MAG: hypothetical protein VYE22_33715 [Myxococcota bacterium]|nr:hypothetical protein [Myxococcota bacterium]